MCDVSKVQCLTYSHQLQSFYQTFSEHFNLQAISHHGFITSTTSVHDLFKFFIAFPDQIFRVVHCLWGNIYQTPLCKLEIYATQNGILIYSLFAVKQNLNQFLLEIAKCNCSIPNFVIYGHYLLHRGTLRLQRSTPMKNT